MKDSKKDGLALLIGVGKPKGKPMMDDAGGEYDDAEPDSEDPADMDHKRHCARIMMNAVKSMDEDAFVKALDMYLKD